MEPLVSESQPEDIDAADVRAFVRVVDLGSMTAAARSLGETKGSVSRRIARLEREVGLALVDRTGNRVHPTEDGLVFRHKAGPALDLLDDAVSSVRDLRGTPTGHLRVTAPVGLGSLLLGPMLGGFAEQFPEVTVETLITDAVLSFGKDRIDVALRLSGGLPDSSLVAHKLVDLHPRPVASPAYIARHGAPEHPDDLARHRLLIVPRRPAGMTLAFARADGSGEPIERTLRGHVLSHDMLLLRDAAIAGAGVAFPLAQLVNADVAAGRLVDLMPRWRVASGPGLWLITAGGTVPGKTRAFRDFVRDRFRRDPACAEAAQSL